MEDLEQRRLAAIVFADVVSYSKLIQKNELQTINSFKSHKTQLFEPLISRFGGRLVKTCLLYTSPSPRDLSTSRMPSSA